MCWAELGLGEVPAPPQMGGQIPAATTARAAPSVLGPVSLLQAPSFPLDPPSPQSQATLGPHQPLQAHSCPSPQPQEQQMSFLDENGISVCCAPAHRLLHTHPRKGEDQGSGCGGHYSGFMRLFLLILTLSF